MEQYILKSSLALALFLTYYWFALRKDTTFRTNRVYLLSCLIVSLILPVIQFTRYVESKTIQAVSEIIMPIQITTNQVTVNAQEITSWWTLQHILILIYFVGATLILVKYIWQIIPWLKLIPKGKMVKGDFKIINTEKSIPPFSFINTIFLGNQEFNETELNKIISHEKEHILQYHWVDLLIVDILSIVFWFNPLIWIYDLLIKQNHEYLADNRVIAQGFNKSSYQTLLLQQVVGVKLPGLSSSLTQSLIKNRFIMMTKQNSKKIAGIKALFAVPLLLFITILFVANSSSTFNSELIAQEEGIIKGYVYDASTGRTLEGASVTLKENVQIGTSTNSKGYFEISTEIKNPSLVISFVGYKTGMVKYNGEIIKVMLKKESIAIDLNKQKVDYSTQDAPPPPPPPAPNNSEIVYDTLLEGEEEVFFIVEDMPYPQGGFEGLSDYIKKSVTINIDKTIEGSIVSVFFVINEKGNPENVKIEKSSGKDDADKLAVKIIEGMPKWKPGTQRGKNVPVEYTIDVEF
jgi:TonB family protein